MENPMKTVLTQEIYLHFDLHFDVLIQQILLHFDLQLVLTQEIVLHFGLHVYMYLLIGNLAHFYSFAMASTRPHPKGWGLGGSSLTLRPVMVVNIAQSISKSIPISLLVRQYNVIKVPRQPKVLQP